MRNDNLRHRAVGEVLYPKYELIVVYPGDGQAYPEELISIIRLELLSCAKLKSGKKGIKNTETRIVKIIKKIIKYFIGIKKLLDIKNLLN